MKVAPSKRHTSRLLLPAASLLVFVCYGVDASAPKPPVPPGQPQAGPSAVMLTTGVDYTRPSVARKLARDGEGDLVGWDAVDRDRRPFGTDQKQSRLIEIAPVRIVPVRVDPHDPASLAEAFSFVRRTPSRVVVVPLPLFGEAMPPAAAALFDAATDLLLVVAAAADGRPLTGLPPSARDRIIVVGALPPGSPKSAMSDGVVDVVLLPPAAAREAPGDAERAPRDGAEAAVLFVAQLSCRRRELAAARDARDAKRILLSAARREGGRGPLMLEDCTRDLGAR